MAQLAFGLIGGRTERRFSLNRFSTFGAVPGESYWNWLASRKRAALRDISRNAVDLAFAIRSAG